jgi:hypothetical protein
MSHRAPKCLATALLPSHSFIVLYLRNLAIGALVLNLYIIIVNGANSLRVLMCRKAVIQTNEPILIKSVARLKFKRRQDFLPSPSCPFPFMASASEPKNFFGPVDARR